MPGRKSKPTQLKVITGNPGGRPLNDCEPEPESGIPKMPEWIELFEYAVENWKEESEILDKINVLTVADAGVLAVRSYLYHQMVTLSKDIETEGMTLGEGNNTKHNPKQKQIEAVIKEYRTLGSLLGLDPSSRSKLSVAKKDSGNEWDDV